MSRKLNFCLFLPLILAVFQSAVSSYVPAILWNVKGDSLPLKPVSTFENEEKIFDELLKGVFLKDASILVFSVNTLSMEDFYASDKTTSGNNTLQSLEAFLDDHPYVILPTVKDPLNHVHKAHCDVEEIIIDQTVDQEVIESVSAALDRSCAVILHLSDIAALKKSEISKIFLPSVKTSKDVLGMFTAVKSSWDVSSNSHHAFRNLLDADDQEQAADDPNFFDIKECMYLYMVNGSMTVGVANNASIHLPMPPDVSESTCDNSTALLKMKFTMSGGPVSAAIITMNFTKLGSSWDSSVTAELTGSTMPEAELQLTGDVPAAGIKFSYSCGHLKLKAMNVSEPITFLFRNFQVQPFGAKGKRFNSSFDCVPFFTVPIWMGIFVAILLIVIMNSGIYALFSIKTMDRFDDPKGKTITVAAATD